MQILRCSIIIIIMTKGISFSSFFFSIIFFLKAILSPSLSHTHTNTHFHSLSLSFFILCESENGFITRPAAFLPEAKVMHRKGISSQVVSFRITITSHFVFQLIIILDSKLRDLTNFSTKG